MVESVGRVIMLISPAYCTLNQTLHAADPDFGRSGHFFGAVVRDIVRGDPGIKTALDYGCGKGTLKDTVPGIEWREYDPAIPGKDSPPAPADLVACTEVLEHIEPECLDAVLDHLKALTVRFCFMTIAFGAALKTLPDGRNTHLIQRPQEWWKAQIDRRFRVFKLMQPIDSETGQSDLCSHSNGIMVLGIPRKDTQ